MIKVRNDVFESSCDAFDVTSLNRPDPNWRTVDAAGHEHRWYANDQPAETYRPTDTYATPTLIWVKDGEEYWDDDDEPHDVGHVECRQCGEHIEPGYTADTCRQFIPGLRSYRINGVNVSQQEYERRLADQNPPSTSVRD